MTDRQRRVTTADVVVIGGGIVGAATAFWLARAGLKPVLIERLDTLAGATTAASAHSVRAQFVEPENIAMMRESIDVYARFPEVVGMAPEDAGIGFVRGGYLFASTEPGSVEAVRRRVTHQRAHGLPDVEALDGDEVRRRFPWMDPAVVAASYRDGDGWLDGTRATEVLARASGATVLLETEVVEVVRDGGRVIGVRTDRGAVATEVVVLAAGPFTGMLAGEPLPLTLVRRHRLVVAPRPEIPAHAPMTVDADTGAHWRPHQGGALVAWARPDAPGPPLSPVPPDPGFPAMVLQDRAGVGRLSPFWRDLAPALTPRDLSLAAGQYTITPDHKPLIGPAAGTAGLWLHTGYSGHGIMGAPAGARLLADLITGAATPDQNPFRPDRPHEHGETDTERMVL
ncbi:MAG: FAD-binding oxidoreductase [Chloroflexota bacterium]|nr:FAD-binding oxidoreductase [Chloroflexota bacterium]